MGTKILLISFAFALVLFSGCISQETSTDEPTVSPEPTCPVCLESSSYSECSDDAVKSRTSYKCDKSTNYHCESYVEEVQCKTEIELSGSAGVLSVTISPSIEEKVSGIIKLEIKAPSDQEVVAYYVEGGDLDPIGTSDDRWPSFATNQGDVWTGLVDTTNYENGVYTIAVSTTKVINTPPEYFAQGQILIEN